jgi:hypothetical protein
MRSLESRKIRTIQRSTDADGYRVSNCGRFTEGGIRVRVAQSFNGFKGAIALQQVRPDEAFPSSSSTGSPLSALSVIDDALAVDDTVEVLGRFVLRLVERGFSRAVF